MEVEAKFKQGRVSSTRRMSKGRQSSQSLNHPDQQRVNPTDLINNELQTDQFVQSFSSYK